LQELTQKGKNIRIKKLMKNKRNVLLIVAAPSLILEELAAVTVPVFEKAGLR